MKPNQSRLTPKQAGARIGPDGHPVSVQTLAWWRSIGRGPKYIKVGGRISYTDDDIDAFIAAGHKDPEAV